MDYYPKGVERGEGSSENSLAKQRGVKKKKSGKKKESAEWGSPGREEVSMVSEGGVPASGTRILSRPLDEFSPLSGESGTGGLGAGGSRTFGSVGGQSQPVCQTLVVMFFRALVNDIKRHDSRR